MSSGIILNGIRKAFIPEVPVIDDLSLAIEPGELVVLLGPSGCGKTTLLKMINRLTEPDSGTIEVDGLDIRQWDPIELRRSIGYVIQQIGLLPHLTVEDNLTYVLLLKKTGRVQRHNRALELMELLNFGPSMLSRYPWELSGGQKQRIGVARALAADPGIILMDEPFGAVDEIARAALQTELKELHRRLKKTIVFVTHDIREAFIMGTRIVLMNQGKIEQEGTAEDLVFRPANGFVRTFFGTRGFTATLDEQVLRDLHRDILDGSRSLDSLYACLKGRETGEPDRQPDH